MLERDLPKHFFCHACLRLCAADIQSEDPTQNRPHPGCAGGSWNERDDLTPKLTGEWLSWRGSSQLEPLHFHEAHMVMRRHFQGPGFGLPIERLQYRYEFERFPEGPKPSRWWNEFRFSGEVCGTTSHLHDILPRRCGLPGVA